MSEVECLDQDLSTCEVNPFFQVVDKLAELYVSYRGRFVTMAQNGTIFVQNRKVGKELIPVKLTNSILAAHLNQHIAVSVYAGKHSAKFMCFDVDDGCCYTVKTIMSLCESAGVPRDRIYVSMSGGKGYHVEVFFDGLVYVSTMRDFYNWVCCKGDLDKRKVEFRPTHEHAIKLPLSRNFKTGRVCWYLDRDTLDPIVDQTYILGIEKFSSEAFTEIAKQCVEEYRKSCVFEIQDINPAKRPDKLIVDVSGFTEMNLPQLTSKGQTHQTMLAIGIFLRNRGLTSENISCQLHSWLSGQNPEFLTDSMKQLKNDIDRICRWLFSNKYVPRRRQSTVFFTREDLELCLKASTKSDRKVCFLIMYFEKKFGRAQLSADRVSEYCGISRSAAQTSLRRLFDAGLINYSHGKTKSSEDGFVRSSNSYWIADWETASPLLDCIDEEDLEREAYVITVLRPEDFERVYYMAIKRLCSNDNVKERLTNTEIRIMEEIQNEQS